MRSIFKVILKFLGFPDTTSAPANETKPEPKPFTIEHDWPFPSPEPTNVDYLIKELIKGTRVEGDHVFFFWGGKKRRHIRTPQGTETILARHIVWWLEGRKVTKGTSGLTTNCGEAKCIKLSHLVLKIKQIPYGPEPKPAEIPAAVIVPKSKQPPQPPKAKGTHFKPPAEVDRNHCISRKAYFPDEISARQEKNKLNKKYAGRKTKLYVYECKLMDCGGWHFTSTNPEKYNQGKKKVGSW